MQFVFAFLIAAAAALSVEGYTIASCREETWAKHSEDWKKGDGEWWLKWTLTRDTGDMRVKCGKMKTITNGNIQKVLTLTAFLKFKISTEETLQEVEISKVYDGEAGKILKSVTFGIEDDPDHIPNYYEAVMFKPNIVYKKVIHNDGKTYAVYSCTDRKPHTDTEIDFRQVYVKENIRASPVDASVLTKMQGTDQPSNNGFEGKITELKFNDITDCKDFKEGIP